MLPDASGIACSGQVKRRKCDEDGNIISHSHSNPILDTGLYEVEFEEGQVGTYAANVIAENIYKQLDDEGFACTLFDSIVNHKRGSDAVSADDGFTEYHGRWVPKHTTCGWRLCVHWKDDSTIWIPLKDLKESHPVVICKEMKTVFPVFEFLYEGAVKLIGYQQITCHLVFDIKMDFTRKARFVAGGHMTCAPLSITYASVVMRESVCIALLIVALNDLEIAGDVQGAYLNAPCREKVYTICGPVWQVYWSYCCDC